MSSNVTGVRILTPARLHFSLIDLNGKLGRVDGGIGVAISKPNWIVKITKNQKWSTPELITDLLNTLREQLDLTGSYKIEFESKLPVHVGLGSQTQLSLAVAHGLSILEGQSHSIYELAGMAGRGGTSGIGVAAYFGGGFIVDGGHTQAEKPQFLPSRASTAKPAILVNRLEVPKDWYFVVAIPDLGMGKHGASEVEIFEKYCPIPGSDVEKLTRIILMQILPALVEDDIDHFGAGLNSIQTLGFKRIENQLQHQFVNTLKDFFISGGAAGSGLSSFGPATFCVVRSEPAAAELAVQAQRYLQEHNHKGTVFYTKANNEGAKVETF